MIIITTRSNSVTINEGVITDNKGSFAIRRKGNTVLVNHKSSGVGVSGIAQEYLCDGQTFTDITVLYNWLSDNLFYKGGGNGEGLQKASNSDAVAGTDDTKYITPKVLYTYVDWITDSLIHEDVRNTEFTIASLNSAYPNALPRTTVYATNLQLKYIKINNTTWEVMPYTIIS